MSFDTPGVVNVYCNIHPGMAAYVIVVDGQNYGLTDDQGRVLLEGVPPGEWSLRIWDEKGGEQRQSVSVRSNQTEPVEISLDASSWRKSSHKNN